MSTNVPPLICHVVYRFDTGGLENGLVNLINGLPPAAYRHAVVALTEVAPNFARRIRRDDVDFIALAKAPGHGYKLFPRLYKLFRELQPTIVHTRNLAALECQLPAWCAGVPQRLHGEHGRDASDPHGRVQRYRWVRRAYRPFVDRYVALSGELQTYLERAIGIPPGRIVRIANGVDSDRFHPAAGGRATLAGCPFNACEQFIVGTVGRMMTVKAQPLLARAFVRAVQIAPALHARLRLVMVGDGPLRAEARAVLADSGLLDLAWLPGERADVPDVMRSLDCFVLPSLAEGISNTILEAMASGLPVLATDVGGNGELVRHGQTGELVPAGDIEALAQALVRMAGDPARCRQFGAVGRSRIESRFGLRAMVTAYGRLYDTMLERQARPVVPAANRH